MKKYFLLFAAGSALALASCGGESTAPAAVNVDSIANVKADSIAAAAKAESEAKLAAQAQATADSLAEVAKMDSVARAAAAKATKSTAKKVAPKTQPKATTVVATRPMPVEENSKGSKMDGQNSSAEGKASKMSGSETEKTAESKGKKMGGK